MTDPIDKAPRMLAALVATAAFGALALQVAINTDPELTALGAAGLMLRYFTIWGNLAAAIGMLHIARGGSVAPPLFAALATALAIIALVYWIALSGMHHPVGIDRITNQFHHTIIPAATIGWWLAYAPPVASLPRALPVIMAGPVLYTVFALVVGEVSGFYAYFFLDRATLSWGEIAVNIAGLAVFFGLTGAGLIAIKRYLVRRRVDQAPRRSTM